LGVHGGDAWCFSRAVQFSYYINNRQPNGSLSNVLSELNGPDLTFRGQA